EPGPADRRGAGVSGGSVSPAANLEARIRKLEPVGGRVSPRTVRRLARATRVSAAVVERELAGLGLAVERVPRLPLAPPVDERGLADAMRALDCRHIVDFLLDGAGHGFVTVDSLYIVAGKLRRVPVRHPELAKLRARWDRRDDIGRRAAADWLLDALSPLLDEDPMGVRRLALVQVTE